METIEYQRMREAEEYHWWYAGLHDLALRWIRREAARVPHPLDILDAGCGTGRLCQLMQPFGPVTGCDLHPLAVAATASRGIPRVLQRNLVTDELGVEAYDLITCMDVLYHRAVVDAATTLLNLQRALKGGGLLMVHVAAFECLRGAHDESVHTRRRYRRQELARLLRATGMEIEFISYRLPLGFVPALCRRRLSRQRSTPGAASPSEFSRWSSGGSSPWLTRLIRLENRWLLAGGRIPFGTSLFAVGRKRVSSNLPVGRLQPDARPGPPTPGRTLAV